MCGLGPADVLMVEDDPGDALMVRSAVWRGTEPSGTCVVITCSPDYACILSCRPLAVGRRCIAISTAPINVVAGHAGTKPLATRIWRERTGIRPLACHLVSHRVIPRDLAWICSVPGT